VTRDVLVKQLDAIDAQLQILSVMVAGMRHTLSAPQAKLPARPSTCDGEQDEHCARLNPEAVMELGGMGGGPKMCKGCGLDPQS
jgi:hypothetical protein